MVVNQLLKYGEFGIVLFDNFQVTERTRNQLYLTVPWVRIPPLPPKQNRKEYLAVLFCCYVPVLSYILTNLDHMNTQIDANTAVNPIMVRASNTGFSTGANKLSNG